MREYYVYIITNDAHGVLYTGVTGDIAQRIDSHKHGKGGKFAAKYNLHKLVYTEVFDDINDAIEREKQIKGGSRAKKIALIEHANPDWIDLYNHLT